MASSGKKGKKPKGKTYNLHTFLQETPGEAPTVPVRKPTPSWADEVEDVYENYDARPKVNVVLPTAPKAARGLDEYSDKIPQNPPYMAYLSNLPYDVEEAEIVEFFGNLEIANMRIPKGDGPKLKGYGYVEFADREGLIGALSIADCTLKNRRIRIEVSNSENDRRRVGRMEMGRERSDRPEISMGDWRSGPRSDPPVDTERRQGGNFSRDRERDGPPQVERAGAWRDGPSLRDEKFSRDDRERFSRDGDRRGFDRDGDRRGFNRDSDRRGFSSRQDDRNGAFYRGGGRDEVPQEKSEPRQRPKLNLKPRTIPVEDVPTSAPEKESEPVQPVPAPVPAPSIFGSAKPVDTSARERQIEERLAKEYVKTDASRDDRRRDDERRRDGDRSSHRGSPERRRFSPRRGSPGRKRLTPERSSPDRRQGSLDKRSAETRGDSPEKRGSSDRRRSPGGRGGSPIRRKSSPYWRGSSDRTKSPDLSKSSPDRRTDSPNQTHVSPDRRKTVSPERGRASPDTRKGSSERWRRSPDRRRESTDRKKGSPERRKIASDHNKSTEYKKISPDRSKGSARRNDGDKKGTKNEKPPAREKERQKREHQEKEMPKFKEPEAPNFVVSNVYSYLQTDSD